MIKIHLLGFSSSDHSFSGLPLNKILPTDFDPKRFPNVYIRYTKAKDKPWEPFSLDSIPPDNSTIYLIAPTRALPCGRHAHPEPRSTDLSQEACAAAKARMAANEANSKLGNLLRTRES